MKTKDNLPPRKFVNQDYYANHCNVECIMETLDERIPSYFVEDDKNSCNQCGLYGGVGGLTPETTREARSPPPHSSKRFPPPLT